VWFTEAKGRASDGDVRAVHPANAPVEGMQSVSRFLSDDRSEGEKRSVVLDGLPYLLLFMDFPKTVAFVKSLADACVVARAGLVIHMDPSAMSPKEQVVLHRLVDEVVG
jgi:hypothetical protein